MTNVHHILNRIWLEAARKVSTFNNAYPFEVIDRQVFMTRAYAMTDALNSDDIALLTERVVSSPSAHDAYLIMGSTLSLFTETRDDIRALKQSAFDRRVVYPADTDWDAVRESVEHMGASGLVDDLFGAVSYV